METFIITASIIGGIVLALAGIVFFAYLAALAKGMSR